MPMAFMAIILSPHNLRLFTLLQGCGFTSQKGQCKHCIAKPKSWNITLNQGPYLKDYIGWKEYQEKNQINIQSKRKKQPAVSLYFSPFKSTSEELFALAIYTSIASFSLFTTPEWIAFHIKLGFKAPIRKALTGILLTNYYNKVKARVQAITDTISYLQIVADRSSNIGKIRI